MQSDPDPTRTATPEPLSALLQEAAAAIQGTDDDEDEELEPQDVLNDAGLRVVPRKDDFDRRHEYDRICLAIETAFKKGRMYGCLRHDNPRSLRHIQLCFLPMLGYDIVPTDFKTFSRMVEHGMKLSARSITKRGTRLNMLASRVNRIEKCEYRINLWEKLVQAEWAKDEPNEARIRELNEDIRAEEKNLREWEKDLGQLQDHYRQTSRARIDQRTAHLHLTPELLAASNPEDAALLSEVRAMLEANPLALSGSVDVSDVVDAEVVPEDGQPDPGPQQPDSGSDGQPPAPRETYVTLDLGEHEDGLIPDDEEPDHD